MCSRGPGGLVPQMNYARQGARGRVPQMNNETCPFIGGGRGCPPRQGYASPTKNLILTKVSADVLPAADKMDVITQFFNAYLVAAGSGCDTTAIRKALVDKADADTQTIFDSMTSWLDPDLNTWLAVCTIVKNIPDQPTPEDLKWYRVNLDQICHLRGVCLPPTASQELQVQLAGVVETMSHVQENMYRLEATVTSLVHGPPSPNMRISRSLSQAMEKSIGSAPSTPVSATPVLTDTNQFPALTTVFKPVVQVAPKRAVEVIVPAPAPSPVADPQGSTVPHPESPSVEALTEAVGTLAADQVIVSPEPSTSPEINVVVLPDTPAVAPKPRKNRGKKQSPERSVTPERPVTDKSLNDAFDGVVPKRAMNSPVRANREKITSVIGYIYDSFAKCNDQVRIDSPYGVVQKLKRCMADPVRADAINKLMASRATYHDIIAAL